MLTLQDMPPLVKKCEQYDPELVLVIGRVKDANVICYRLTNSIMEPYWRMHDGSEVAASFFEKKMALKVQSEEGDEGRFFLVGAPNILFVLNELNVFHDGLSVHYVFLGPKLGFFDNSPSYITIQYTNKSTKTIKF